MLNYGQGNMSPYGLDVNTKMYDIPGLSNLNTVSNLNLTAPNATVEPGFLSNINWLSSINPQGMKTAGVLDTAMGVGQGLFNMYNAWGANKRANEMFKFQKEAYKNDFNTQANLTNQRLESMFNSRYAANPNAYVSPAEQMKKYGVKNV